MKSEEDHEESCDEEGQEVGVDASEEPACIQSYEMTYTTIRSGTVQSDCESATPS